MQPARSGNPRSRRPAPEFQMPLPRFHPAVYQSPSGSTTNAMISPRIARNTPSVKPPSSPRQQQPRQYNEATRKLIEYQQEILRATGASGPNSIPSNLPHTPSLVPCGSPGPATPLNLEDQSSDYLVAGATRRGIHGDAASQRELIENMIREEQDRRQGGVQSGPSSPPVSPAAAS